MPTLSLDILGLVAMHMSPKTLQAFSVTSHEIHDLVQTTLGHLKVRCYIKSLYAKRKVLRSKLNWHRPSERVLPECLEREARFISRIMRHGVIGRGFEWDVRAYNMLAMLWRIEELLRVLGHDTSDHLKLDVFPVNNTYWRSYAELFGFTAIIHDVTDFDEGPIDYTSPPYGDSEDDTSYTSSDLDLTY